MIYFTTVQQKDEETGESLQFDLFLFDDSLGYSMKSICNVPGAYEELVSEYKIKLYLAKLDGVTFNHGSTYSTSLIGAIVDPEEDFNPDTVIDITQELAKYVAMPESALEVVLSREDEQVADIVRKGLDAWHFIEQLDTQTKVYMPEEAFEYMDDADKQAMMLKDKVYILKRSDNTEVFQKDCKSEYIVSLPSIEEIQAKQYSLSVLDLLRVTAPLRKKEAGGKFWAYNTIFHTPYYKVNPRIKGRLPQHLDWLDGLCMNDGTEIQPYERKMFDNLNMLICSDVFQNTAELITGMFFNTSLGISVRNLINQKDKEAMLMAHSEIMEKNSDMIACNVTIDDITSIYEDGVNVSSMSAIIKQRIEYKPEFIEALFDNFKQNTRIINIDNLPFVLSIDQNKRSEYTEQLINMGVLSNFMFDFLRHLCSCAYALNWGHTGVTKAIPKFVDAQKLDAYDKIMGDWVSYAMTGDRGRITNNISELFDVSSLDDFEQDFNDSEGYEESFGEFDHYLSQETINRMQVSELTADYFSNTGSMSPETAIIERWRKENGDNSLYVFLSKCYVNTASPKCLIECFIKLMRWGDMKPKYLSFPNFPQIKELFSLEDGEITADIDNIDDSMLIRKNGCAYSLVRPVYAESNLISVVNPIVGFHLEKDYGTVTKVELASWLDIGSMLLSSNIDVAEFKTISDISLSVRDSMPIESYGKIKFSFYTSDKLISEAIDKNVPAIELNDIYLLTTPNIVESQGYLRFQRNQEVITLTDMQYFKLMKYTKALSQFYAAYSSEIADVANTSQLAVLAKKFVEVYETVNSASPQTGAHNGIGTMSLGGSSHYISCQLDGKAALIYDDTMEAPFAPITFSDVIMRKASEKLRNRVVMLLMDVGDKYVLCRADISIGDVMRTANGNLFVKNYSKLAEVVKLLESGKNIKISGKNVYLHESIK